MHHPMWYRVAGLKPRLRPHARIYRHHYRGQSWYVLQDRASTRYYRLSTAAHGFISLLDGRRSVQDVLDAVGAKPGQEAPSPKEVIQLLAKLHAADMLQSDVLPDAVEIFARSRRESRRESRGRLLRPLALRFPLLDPDRFLSRALPMVRPLFRPLGLFLWLAVVLGALVLSTAHWSELTAYGALRATDPRNLLLLWLLYPIVKALHEFGHAFATKMWGGEVHEMGVMLLVLMPIPYVDASAANAFGDKRRRMLVAAAGIMVEAFLAAVAMFVWLGVQPGLVRDMAFDVMLVGGVSTVLFNGNPLLRFDGYYVLADAVEIPNLGPRSGHYLGYLVKRYLFGLKDAPSPVTAPGERGWFLAYGVASALYRLFISFAIALFVAGKFFVVGVVLAVWAIGAQLLYPALRHLAFVFASPALQGRRLRPVAVVSTAALAVTVFVLAVPVPSWTRAEGIIRLPEESLVRAGTDGFVVRLLSVDGEAVREGDPLLELEDPLLDARLTILEWRLRELEARHAAEQVKDQVQAEIIEEEIAEVQAELDQEQARHAGLMVHSPTGGTFRMERAKDLPGRFVRKGDLLGHVVGLSPVTARVVVPQTAANLVRRRTQAVQVRLANRPGETIDAEIEREVPSATQDLPSRVLGTLGGGAIAVDARDAQGVKAIDRVFQLDVGLPPRGSEGYLASRVFVRFDHGREPLARQWYRSLRQLFLARFDI